MISAISSIILKHSLFGLFFSTVGATVIRRLPAEYEDLVFWIFTFIGVIISLFLDASDKETKIKLNTQYILFSLAVSFAFALLMVEASRAGIISGFWFYFFTLGLSTFAPSFVNIAKATIPVALSAGAVSIIKDAAKAAGQWLINKSK